MWRIFSDSLPDFDSFLQRDLNVAVMKSHSRPGAEAFILNWIWTSTLNLNTGLLQPGSHVGYTMHSAEMCLHTRIARCSLSWYEKCKSNLIGNILQSLMRLQLFSRTRLYDSLYKYFICTINIAPVYDVSFGQVLILDHEESCRD